MFPFMLFSTLFSSTITEPGEKRWVCNSSDTSVWYSYCVNAEPCITLKGGRGNLYLYYIPRRDIKSLYFNIYVSFKSVNFPVRKEVICQGSDDYYSFCRALKGETVNTTITFSFREIRFSKGRYNCITEAITGNTEERLFCLNFTVIYHPDFS
ncbi:lymphocyte antigen 96 isoform X2 [Kogia breviceps]|uniref:lymphocyte antigen 96 isoform X2 n=1 Tax=Kogia breviceps TaxID=27615 RepID=UPI002795BFA7|nr:lymphocyte antigen 96 isoform X2 [Kogia breviceps]